MHFLPSCHLRFTTLVRNVCCYFLINWNMLILLPRTLPIIELAQAHAWHWPWLWFRWGLSTTQSLRVPSCPDSGCAGTWPRGPAAVDWWSAYAGGAGDRRCRYFRCCRYPTMTSSATCEAAYGRCPDVVYHHHIAPLQIHLPYIHTHRCQQASSLYWGRHNEQPRENKDANILIKFYNSAIWGRDCLGLIYISNISGEHQDSQLFVLKFKSKSEL